MPAYKAAEAADVGLGGGYALVADDEDAPQAADRL